MSYQVLARKWRPRTFGEMVGQTHVLQALVNALDNDRLHHAYLFTGTRGVGKTTVARIFAKSLNCEQGVGSTPCGECSACTEIDAGRFVDLIEVDAASRTKVEDTRELLDNVQYTPTRGRYKVYLIDEVHMLSAHSFNALLKTLEEPPPHVKFLLATTDPQRLPATVLSRCLQFSLKRLAPDQIAGHLAQLLEHEGIGSEGAALRLLARAADGSMRDALSLLDQAIAFGGGRVNETEVRTMLGTIDQGQVFGILRALAGLNGAAVLAALASAAERAPDFEALLAELLSVLQQVAVAQTVPDALGDEVDDREAILDLAGRMTPEDVQLFYQIGLIGRRDLPLAPDPRGGLEMILLRMLAFRPAPAGSAQSVAAPENRDAGGSQRSRPPVRTAAQKVVGAVESAGHPPPADGGDDESDWRGLVERLALRGMLRELAMNCACERKDADDWMLSLGENHRNLLNDARLKQLQKAVCDALGRAVRLRIDVAVAATDSPAAQKQREAEARRRRAVEAIEGDPNVEEIRKAFDATLHAESIRPVDH
jgi:DNA polymerase-3 subunit gamma/tau